MLVETVLALSAFLAFLYIRFRQRCRHWDDRGVKVADGNAFPLGSAPMTSLDVIRGRLHFSDVIRRQYEENAGEKYYGVYGPIGAAPILVLRDLDLIEHVLVKDFSSFVDRVHAGFDDMKGTSETDAIWKKQLLNLKGDQWKTVRAKFSPIFTAGKLKTMMGFVDAVCNEMSKEVEPASENNQDIDLKTLCGKFSMETIASCAFGLSAGSFACDTETEFITNAKATFSMKPADGIRMLSYMIPGIRQAIDTLRISIVKPTETRFFVSLIKAAVRERRSSGRRRNDMIDLMIDAIENEQKTELDEDTVVATAMVLLIAGYDTTALTMSYCLWRLALNPEVQARVQQEIDEMVAKEAIHGEQMLDYSSLQNLEYLEQVLNETLRLHPPFGAHTRRCTRDYVLPGTEVTIRKGDEVQIPAVGIHFDERYFPNAETFDPDRFSKEAQVVRHSMAFMPFGHGPRICIGMRFALLESKAAIANILRKYDIVAGPNTPTKVSLAPGSVSARADKTLWVKARRRQRT